MQKLLRYLKGYLEITVDGEYVERFLNMCSYHEIELWNLHPYDHSYKMNISVSGYRRIKSIVKKTKSKVKIISKCGFPFFIYEHRKRQLFVLAFLVVIFSLYASTFYIHGIEIEGNLFYSKNMIIEELKKENVYAGIRKEKIECDKIVRLIREKYDKVTWASAYLQGTKLIVAIKESQNLNYIANDYYNANAQNLVSNSDGTIVSIITRSGKPQVHVGDKVKIGDVLVSGEIEVKNDSGEIVAYKYVKPDGDIIVETELEYTDSIEKEYIKKSYKNKIDKTYRIETKNRIIVFGNKNSKRKAVKLYKQICDLGLLKIGVELSEEYKEEIKRHDMIECQKILSNNFSKFCEDLEKKGVQILQNSVKIYSESERAFSKGTLIVHMRNGKMQQTDKKVLEKGN